MQTARRSGFSLIEALVVLAIGGMALTIVFSIGLKAGETGFSLGRRAMSAADADVAVSDLRSIFRSLEVRPSLTFIDGVDTPLVGEPDRLEGDVVIERANGCAPQGWAGRLILTIETQADQRVVMCQAGSRRTPLVPLPRGVEAAFSYSLDGRTWTPEVELKRLETSDDDLMRSRKLFVRINGGPALDVMDIAQSGFPNRWVRHDGSL
nr:prepilin-type N-terminal cleavage/methylation domain-containing protein [Brevundimonas diminuta]